MWWTLGINFFHITVGILREVGALVEKNPWWKVGNLSTLFFCPLSRHQTENKRTESALSQEASRRFISIWQSLSFGLDYFALNRRSPKFRTKFDGVQFEEPIFKGATLINPAVPLIYNFVFDDAIHTYWKMNSLWRDSHRAQIAYRFKTEAPIQYCNKSWL